MKYSTLKKVTDLMRTSDKELRGVTELAEALGRTTMTVHGYLRVLVERGEVLKHPNGAHTVYSLVGYETLESSSKYGLDIPYEEQALLDDAFYKLGSTGREYIGYDGFVERCGDRNEDPQQKVGVFIETVRYLDGLRDTCGLLDATEQLSEIIEGSAIDTLWYADQYNYPNFGRGKLAEMTFYGKATENKILIQRSIQLVRRRLQCLIHTSGCDSIAITPHSINRRVQLLPSLLKTISTDGLYEVSLTKYIPSIVPIPQKSLKKREDRIRNARETILVEERDLSHCTHVLLVDDFVGSGSTLNETAKKLKALGVKKVTCFAFVGNLNLSYEVIREI